jgi:hypothetical protein
MRTGYTVFPHSGYVLETFRGAITFRDLVDFTARQQLDNRILYHYHTVSDYAHASMHLTECEVRQYCESICALPTARAGRRALVVSGPRNLAFASMVDSRVSQSGVSARCFRSRNAALHWLGEQFTECPRPDHSEFARQPETKDARTSPQYPTLSYSDQGQSDI